MKCAATSFALSAIHDNFFARRRNILIATAGTYREKLSESRTTCKSIYFRFAEISATFSRISCPARLTSAARSNVSSSVASCFIRLRSSCRGNRTDAKTARLSLDLAIASYRYGMDIAGGHSRLFSLRSSSRDSLPRCSPRM